MMTVYGTLDVMAGAVRLGAYRVVGKPLDMRDLASLVQQAYASLPIDRREQGCDGDGLHDGRRFRHQPLCPARSRYAICTPVAQLVLTHARTRNS